MSERDNCRFVLAGTTYVMNRKQRKGIREAYRVLRECTIERTEAWTSIYDLASMSYAVAQ